MGKIRITLLRLHSRSNGVITNCFIKIKIKTITKVNSYLNFNGNTEEAFNFYKSVFGGEFAMVQRLKDAPDGDKLSESDKEKIMHMALPIGDNVLMALTS